MKKIDKLIYRKILLIVFIFLNTCLVQAEVGLQFDKFGHIKRPDNIILIRGIKHEKKQNLKKAMRDYKLSAEFGNNKAMFFISLLYFQQKQWDYAYAWLRLMNEGFTNSKQLTADVKLLMHEKELQISNHVLAELKEKYNPKSFLKRREHWNNSIKITGTHIRGLELVHDVDIYYGGALNNMNRVNLEMAKQEMENYIYDYKSIESIITMGEIVPVEDTEK